MTGRERERRVDYSFGPGKSPTMGAVNAGLAAFNATAIAYETHAVSPMWGVGVGVLAAGSSILALTADNHLRHTEGKAMCYRAACWLGAGIWSTVQLARHPWSWGAGVALAAGVMVAAFIGESLKYTEGRRNAVKSELPKLRAGSRQERIAAVWEPLIRRVCRQPGIVVEGVDVWPTGDGFTLGGLLPDDGTTVDDIKPFEKSLATAAGLEPGCNVEIIGNIVGQPRRVFHARVNTFNAMAQPQTYPDDYSNRSIVDPINVGVASDRSIGTIHLLDDGAAVVGQKGSGKSTLLNVITTEVVRCTDALVFAIDTKGFGEYPRRWVRAWYEGRAARPAIHLAAVTDDQAELMALGLLNIANGRPGAYAELMAKQNAVKIMPSPQLPQLILVVDEFKSLPDSVKEAVEELNDKGRSAGIEVVVCALEATSRALPAGILTQLRERIGLRFNSEAHLQYLFDATWRSGRFDPASMTHAGMMMVSTGAQPPSQVKGYHQDPALIDRISTVVGEQRPPLDQASIDMFNTITRRVRNDDGDWVTETLTGVYDSWWEKTLPLMFGEGSARRAVTAAAPARTQPRQRASSQQVLDAMAASGVEMQEALEAARAAANAADAEQPPADGFEAIVAQYDQTVPAREQYYDILRSLGGTPIGATEMTERLRAQGHRTVRQTVQDWLVEDYGRGKVDKLDGGKYVWAGES